MSSFSTESKEEKKNVDQEQIRPFEWLTNAESLRPTLCSLFGDDSDETDENSTTVLTGRKALHVGCGSSTLGEYLIRELDCELVVNVDIDQNTLEKMQNRWEMLTCSEEASVTDRDRLQFCHCDLSKDRLPYSSGYFDLIADKSVLDCTLCSDEASAGLLCEMYRCLNPIEGVYVVVSFHHVDMLIPLLEKLPGADWTVSHSVMYRQVEDLRVANGNPSNNQQASIPVDEHQNSSSAWSSGSFSPDEQYRRTVNVLVCRRHSNSTVTDTDRFMELDRDAVRDHIHETNDNWFQKQNPMLTRIRQEELERSFESHGGSMIPLRACYEILFTAAEREHLSYDLFMEDWNAFLESRPSLVADSMSLETALDFLEEMQ